MSTSEGDVQLRSTTKRMAFQNKSPNFDTYHWHTKIKVLQ